MAQVVDRGDRDQGAQQPWVDRVLRYAARVEAQGEEADGDVERLSGDLVPMDEGAEGAVDGDEAKG